MANNDFDRMIENVRERPLSSDINQLQSQSDRTFRDFLSATFAHGSLVFGSYVMQGCVGSGFSLQALSGLQTFLGPGFGFLNNPSDVPSSIGGIVGLDDRSPYKPIVLTGASQTLTTPAADPSNPRIDLVEVTYNRVANNPQSRDVLNTGTAQFNPSTVNKTLQFVLDGIAPSYVPGGSPTSPINYKQGVASGTPVIPTVDAGYIPVGAIWVPAAASGLTAANLIDYRSNVFPSGAVRLGGWITINHSTGAITGGAITGAPPGWSVVMATFLQGGTISVGLLVYGPGFDFNQASLGSTYTPGASVPSLAVEVRGTGGLYMPGSGSGTVHTRAQAGEFTVPGAQPIAYQWGSGHTPTDLFQSGVLPTFPTFGNAYADYWSIAKWNGTDWVYTGYSEDLRVDFNLTMSTYGY